MATIRAAGRRLEFRPELVPSLAWEEITAYLDPERAPESRARAALALLALGAPELAELARAYRRRPNVGELAEAVWLKLERPRGQLADLADQIWAAVQEMTATPAAPRRPVEPPPESAPTAAPRRPPRATTRLEGPAVVIHPPQDPAPPSFIPRLEAPPPADEG